MTTAESTAQDQEVILKITEAGDSVERMELAKARLLRGEELVAQRSNLQDTSETMDRFFTEAGTISPPFEPAVLVRLYGVSNALRQNIDGLVQNVHGGGHTYEPVLDFEKNETWETVKIAMLLERERQAEMEAGDDEPEAVDEPTDQEVDDRIEQLKNQSRRELARLKAFFDFCVREHSFVRLRRRMGTDEETIGWGAWEVLRNGRGEPKRLRYAPAWTLRATKRSQDPVEVKDVVRTSPITWEEVTEARSFRLYVQVYEGRKVYFKEYGDPRTISTISGKAYDDVDQLKEAEPKARPATELMWFPLDNPESDVYGLIRWSGNILSVLGSREMEEVNLLFFDNKAIPPLVVLVSGGHLAADAKEELQQIIKDHIKGRRNFHRILILEAESGSMASSLSGLPGQQSVKIEIKPLTEHIFKDQLWGDYDKDNRHKVGQSFRMPPILRGDTKDFNRSTGQAAWRITEDQVFQPDRDDVDFEINRTLVKDLRVSLWRFRSKSTFKPDPEAVLESVEGLTNSVFSPEETRPIAAQALGVEIPRTEAAWAKVPLRYAAMGFEGGEPDEPTPPKPGPAPAGDGEGDNPEEKTPPVDRVKVSPEQFRRLFPSEPPRSRDE